MGKKRNGSETVSRPAKRARWEEERLVLIGLVEWLEGAMVDDSLRGQCREMLEEARRANVLPRGGSVDST